MNWKEWHLCGIKFTPSQKYSRETNRYKFIGDNVTAIIYAATFFEKWVFKEVSLKLDENGFTKNQIENELTENSGRYINHYDAIYKVTKNRRFKETNEFREYKNNVVGIWNIIIHRDGIEVTAQMAEKAIISLNNLKTLLIKEIWISI